jgi:hypothetical protein
MKPAPPVTSAFMWAGLATGRKFRRKRRGAASGKAIPRRKPQFNPGNFQLRTPCTHGILGTAKRGDGFPPRHHLAGASCLALTGVLLRRGFTERRERQLKARRKALMNLGLGCLEERDPAACLRERLHPADRQSLLRLFADLLPKVRGEYAERVVTMMRELGLRDQCLERLRSRLA